MKLHLLTLPFAVLTFLLMPARAAEMSAGELAGRLNEGMQGNARIRARLEIAGGNPETPVLQLQIKERRAGGTTDVAYEVLWPKERQGETVLLQQSGGGAPSGTLKKATGQTEKLSSSDMAKGLFGSELAYQDVVENFYAWPSQSITGTEEIDGRKTLILESKPGGAESIYGSVRSWIDPERMVPLQIEKFSKSGSSVRKIITTRVSKDDRGRIIPANLEVRKAGSASRTRLTGSRIDQDVRFSESDFSSAP